METGEAEMVEQKVVAAVIFDDVRKSVLVGKRASDKPFAGKWEFIGGKVEKDESLEEAVGREASEETNFLVSPIAPLGESTFKAGKESFDVTFFECEIKSGDVGNLVPGREHSKLEWVATEDLESLDWVGLNGDFAKWLVEFNKTRQPISGDIQK